MKHHNLQDFISRLEAHNELIRVQVPVSAQLEITEIVNRVSKGPASANKALLFETVPGYDMPVLVNLFGSARRMAWALHVEELESLRNNLATLLDRQKPHGTRAILHRAWGLFSTIKATGIAPRRTKHAPVQEVVHTKQPSLDELPILTCWPNDGGPFITLPQVVTRHPEKGTRNVGMYRLQKVNARTLLVHWQKHKDGAEHARRAMAQGQTKLPAAIVLGGDPTCTWVASAPLPPDVDEYWLAGWLRGTAVPLVHCITQPLDVPAHADIVIEGVIDLQDQRLEGPFGDHTGYYTPKERFPTFHVTAITHRRAPIYPATVVGIPPMEDYWMGKATERLFLPLLQLLMPEVVDYAMPAPGVFHNLVLVSIAKRYPGHARKVIHGLWGIALLSLAKAIVVVDDWVDLHNPTEVAWQALGNVDWSRDVIHSDGAVDQLDHASRRRLFGGKIGVDATAKWPEEGHSRPWPEVVRMSPQVQARIDPIWKSLGLT